MAVSASQLWGAGGKGSLSQLRWAHPGLQGRPCSRAGGQRLEPPPDTSGWDHTPDVAIGRGKKRGQEMRSRSQLVPPSFLPHSCQKLRKTDEPSDLGTGQRKRCHFSSSLFAHTFHPEAEQIPSVALTVSNALEKNQHERPSLERDDIGVRPGTPQAVKTPVLGGCSG